MKAKKLLMAAATLMTAGMFLMTGCSSESDGSSGETESLTNQAIDEFVESTYVDIQPEEPAEVEFASVNQDSEEVVIGKDSPQFYDMVFKDDIVYATIDDGILTYNIVDGSIYIIPAESPVTAMVDLGDKILVGGKNLYKIDEYELSDEDFQLNLSGTITALCKHGLSLMIGTTDGFYVLDPSGIRELASNIHVSAIVSDGLGIWVGTAGEGLYRWSGVSFKKRYLQRDSTLFDNVTALDYNRNHLYLGTDKGLFVHDGGRWTPFGLADGLPSETITAINADEWVVKVGTSRGPVTFFNNEFKLISKLEGMVITRFIKDENKLLAATTNAGLVMKSGGLVTTLFDGETETGEIALEEPW
jgi:hypothetical protein